MIMSSKEIIKALRRGLFSNELLQISADTIEKFESEISRLQTKNAELQTKLTEVEQKEKQVLVMLRELKQDILNDIITAKVEAYKEFAELVKANKRKLFNYIYSSTGFDNQIDNLLKEKVGDSQ